MASSSAPSGIAQKTVSRMIIGGSTGFRMMMALPLGVPPSSRTAREVVCVNSSMLARVPGPADFEATDATISAYGTSTTDETAWTIGTVACAPQLIMFTLSAFTCSVKFTGGQTSGPTAAGVRSTATMPAAFSRGAASRWGEAGVGGKDDCGQGARG